MIFKINNNNNTAGREIEGVLVSTHTLCPPVRELIRFLCISQVSSFVVSDSFFLNNILTANSPACFLTQQQSSTKF